MILHQSSEIAECLGPVILIAVGFVLAVGVSLWLSELEWGQEVLPWLQERFRRPVDDSYP
jgi:hypothetical protein